jgi:predicted PurR-regulated permease PerM
VVIAELWLALAPAMVVLRFSDPAQRPAARALIPAVGTGLIWVPVALYLLATGAIVKALILIGCGIFVIGLVDNLLRPILVGRDTRIPDYVVLITTLGGIDMFGFNGIVIGPVIAALFIATRNIVTRMRTGDGIEGPLTKEGAGSGHSTRSP